MVVVSVGVVSLIQSDAARAGVLSNSWRWPVDAPHPVIREFRAPTSEYGRGHRGIDIAVADGTPVRSPAEGHVLFVGEVAGRGVITIEHENDVVSTLEPVRGTVAPGDRVAAGDIVGVVVEPEIVWDSSHVCSCVHLGARYAGEYVSPRVLLERMPGAVLKPWGDGPTLAGALAHTTL